MNKKIKKYKVGMDSETYAISLVESPAIEEELVALEKNEPVKIQLANDEKHLVYSAVLVPDKPIYRRNDDGDEYYIEFSRESIEKMSQDFLKEYRQNEITLDHETMATDITLVESWLKADPKYDKSVAIGLSKDLPVGTWCAALKVNQIDVWERIKSGELKGFSVESMIKLEDFADAHPKDGDFNKNEKIENKMEIELDNMKFWDRLKEVVCEAFMIKNGDDDIEPIDITDMQLNQSNEVRMEAQSSISQETAQENVVENNEATTDENEAAEPILKPSETISEPQPTDTNVEENKAIVDEIPTQNDNHMQELVNKLLDEVKALKELNNGLTEKIADLGKKPSANPINTNANNAVGTGTENSNYLSWRETMRAMVG